MTSPMASPSGNDHICPFGPPVLISTGGPKGQMWSFPLGLAIGLVIFAASWALSVKWFEQREL